MRSGARRLAGGIEAGNVASPCIISAHSTHAVVRGGRNGNRIGLQIVSPFRKLCGQGRKARRYELVIQMLERQVVRPMLAQVPVDRPRDAVSWLQGIDDFAPFGVYQQGALAA